MKLIRDNLCLGKNIPDEKIYQLLDEAGMTNWYKELPDGLDTMVGENSLMFIIEGAEMLLLLK